jgi:uncharacterized protein involved in exopolysaccharide biosynthesis
LASGLTLSGIIGVNAAEKPEASPPTTTSPKLAVAERHEKSIKRLEEELKRHDQIVKEKQAEIDHMKVVLGISDLDAAGSTGNQTEPGVLQRLEIARIEAYAEAERTQNLYSHLTNLTRVALRQAISTAAPDSQAIALFEQLANAEQKLAALTESQGPDHPEIKSVRRVQERIKRQIEDRLDGILTGLKLKGEAENARVEALQRELDAYKKRNIEMAIQRRPYFQARRDLEALQMIRERLTLRLIQEKVDAAIPLSDQ